MANTWRALCGGPRTSLSTSFYTDTYTCNSSRQYGPYDKHDQHDQHDQEDQHGQHVASTLWVLFQFNSIRRSGRKRYSVSVSYCPAFPHYKFVLVMCLDG